MHNNKHKIIRTAIGSAALALLLGTSLGAAAEPLRIQTPVTYAENAPVMPRLREECHIEDMLGSAVLREVSKKYPDTSAEADPAALGQGRVLRLTILQVQGVGGGGWSGSKSIMVRGDLLQDGQVVRTGVHRDRSRGGLLGPAQSTCGILGIVADSLGEQITVWLGMRAPAAPPAPVAEPAAAVPAAPDAPAADANPQSAS